MLVALCGGNGCLQVSARCGRLSDLTWAPPPLVRAALAAASRAVVFHDVGGPDSLASVVEALQHLDMVASQVFDRISTRVTENKQRLANIKNVRVALLEWACSCAPRATPRLA